MQLYRRRGGMLPAAVAFVLLAEAMGAVAVGRSWHATWWEWHALMAIAFGIRDCKLRPVPARSSPAG